MRAPKNKPTAASCGLGASRSCARAPTIYLGVVYAPDQKAAEAAAIAEFKIADEQRRRLIVRAEE
jgi:hypothetical protein